MQSRKILIASGIVVLAIVVMLGLAGLKPKPPKKEPKENIRHVRAGEVRYGDIHTKVHGAGRLASKQHVDVIAEVQGKILPGDVPLKKGQAFKKGALLFRIFSREAHLNLLAKKSRFLNAIANLLPDFKVDFPASYPKWKDFLAAIDIQKNIPPLPEIKVAKEKIFLSGRNILSDYFSIKSEEVRLKKYSVHAPFSGTYTTVMLEVGSVVNPGSKVGKIIRTDTLELEAPVEVRDAQWVNIGDTAIVTTEDGSREWQGKVVRKSNFVEPTTQSISVFVALQSTPENPLFLGLYLKAVFPGGVVHNAMKIPRNAVFNTNEVFTINDGRLVKKQVSIHKVNEKTLIFSGLKEGTKLVVEPLINAVENMKVEILAEEK